MEQAEHGMLILGSQAICRDDGAYIIDHSAKLAEKFDMVRDDWNGFNILHKAASRVGALDIGFVPGKGGLDVKAMVQPGALDVLYLLGADEISMDGLKDTFVIYQGHHGDKGASHADVVLPGCAYTEKSGTYVNTEGRVQQTRVAVGPPGDAREDWKIVRALAEELGINLPYDTINEIRQRMIEGNPVFANLDQAIPGEWHTYEEWDEIQENPLLPWSGNFYMSDPISRHSTTMAQCAREQGRAGGSDA